MMSRYRMDRAKSLQSANSLNTVTLMLTPSSSFQSAHLFSLEDSQLLPVGEGGKILSNETISIPMDGLVIQSVIGKWLGPLADWKPHLDCIRDRGYNMLHFTPLQKRGQSNSPYSLYDQCSFDDALFGNKKLTEAEKNNEMKKVLRKLRDESGLLSLIDVVLNHTADNTDWLQDHPEAGKYNFLVKFPLFIYFSTHRLQYGQLTTFRRSH